MDKQMKNKRIAAVDNTLEMFIIRQNLDITKIYYFLSKVKILKRT